TAGANCAHLAGRHIVPKERWPVRLHPRIQNFQVSTIYTFINVSPQVYIRNGVYISFHLMTVGLTAIVVTKYEFRTLRVSSRRTGRSDCTHICGSLVVRLSSSGRDK